VDGPAFYAYSINYLIDVQAGIIVDVEATSTLRTAEVNATRMMILKLDRLRLRGPNGAHDEFILAATAQNLRRLAKRLFPTGLETAKMAI